MPEANRDRVLVISNRGEVRNELVTLLSGYGYFVEYCATRREGIRKFRSHKQSIVILDVNALRTYQAAVRVHPAGEAERHRPHRGPQERGGGGVQPHFAGGFRCPPFTPQDGIPQVDLASSLEMR